LRSHTRTFRSVPMIEGEPMAEIARRPSALTATASTRPRWPGRASTCAPVSRFHTRTAPSPPPEIARRKAGRLGITSAMRLS
jgi:hypothetical protein